MSFSHRPICQLCKSTRFVLFCTDCTQLQCKRCCRQRQIEEWKCHPCNLQSPGSLCGRCGSETSKIGETMIDCCTDCGSINLGDPGILLNNLAKDFFAIVSSIQDILPDLNDLHRNFDFQVTLVRLCRLAGFTGFPVIEDQLKKCSVGLKLITEKGINQLIKIRKEILFDLRSIDNFKELNIEHYRNADSIIQNTKRSINLITSLIRHWIEEVGEELNKLVDINISLKQHYELLTKINRYLPEEITNVTSIIPPISLKIQVDKHKFNEESYVVFSEHNFVCLPENVFTQKNQYLAIGSGFSYKDIKQVYLKNSIITGCNLIIEMQKGSIQISGPPQALHRIHEYFIHIISDDPFFIKSPKIIMEIESKSPDKNEYKRATQKFIDVFRSKLFGDPLQKTPLESSPISISELKNQFVKLEKSAKDIDFRAKNLQINPDEYKNYRHQIKSELQNIRENINRLGGHLLNFSQEYDPNLTNIDIGY
ncbi:MAG: hypothetical protein OEY49_01585 [Candidatus Heimdallarchaeota archaeon]|nr:hypothetical protein [Candidatus Heimdallarchaeota archaeon]